jgi:filamentous hemagglutinin
LANQTKQLGDAVKDATGSSLIGNISGNVISALGGALLGGSSAAAMASNVNLYNQGNDKSDAAADEKEASLQSRLWDAIVAVAKDPVGTANYALNSILPRPPGQKPDADASPLTDVSGGNRTPPTGMAVVTPPAYAMTPEGPVPIGLGVGSTVGSVPKTALLSDGGGNTDSNGSEANKGSSGSVTSPNAAMRANANASGTYVDPITGLVVPAEGTLAVDHIVPQSWIKQQPGFDQLSQAQQSALLNDPVNTQGLPTTFNSSKGAQMPGEWTTYKGQPLDSDYVQNGATQAATLQAYITSRIRSMLGE